MATAQLRKSVAVMAKFTNHFHKGYGKTPGKFVVGYVAREDATESLTPLSNHQLTPRLDSYVTRYLAHDHVVFDAQARYESPSHLQRDLLALGDLTGRSFGDLGLSYAKADLLAQADVLQQLYDQGHSIEKLVISFTTDYAKRMGILSSDYQHVQRGDFAGQVDQLRLRTAVNHGMSAMAKRAKYQDPLWMGSIQVDTNHLHVHMVLGDRVKFADSKRLGQFYGHVEERGKLTPLERDSCREGIEFSLLEHRPMRHLHTQTDLDEAVDLESVQSLVQYQYGDNSQLQLLLASLPINQRLWRAENQDPVMRRPHAIMNQYLNGLIDKYDDQLGYSETLQVFQQQAKQAVEDNHHQYGINHYFTPRVVALRQSLQNQIYQQLQTLTQSNPQLLTTAYLTQQARDPEALQAQIAQVASQPQGMNTELTQMMLFAYRLTSYRQRLQEHQSQQQRFYTARYQFDQQALQHRVSTPAFAMRGYYQSESKYHAQALDKYRYFFKVDGYDDNKQVQAQRASMFDLRVQRRAIMRQGAREHLWTLNDTTHEDNQLLRQQFANQMLYDPRLGRALQQSLTNSDVESVGLAVMNARDDSHYEFPNEAFPVIQAIARQVPEYAEMEHAFALPAPTNTAPSNQLVAMYAKYVMGVDSRSQECFAQGLIPATELVDGLNEIQRFEQVPEGSSVVPLVNPRSRSEFLTPDYFRHLKGVDLDDLGFDFGPGQNRQVNPRVGASYQRLTRNRLRATTQAYQFLGRTHQVAVQKSLDPVVKQLQQNQQLGDVVAQTHQLPMGVVKTDAVAYDDQRQFKSVSIQQANRLTRDQLGLLRELNLQTRNLDHVVNSSAETAPSQSLPSQS